MDIKALYDTLLQAYSTEHLNLITGKLIALYKNKNYGKIRELANKVSKYVPIDEEKASKCFTKLVVLYHPDKGDQIRKTLLQLYEQNDLQNLNKYAHIFQLEDIDHITVVAIDEDVDYAPEYGWDTPTADGYSFSDYEEEMDGEAVFETSDFEKSFFNLIKIRQYGTVDIEFPTYYLEDYEEFEMAYSGLESLDGVEYCIHVKNLDVSNNDLSDIESLWGLENLEELYLANNQIGYIDTLSSLVKLKTLDISGNQIDDISPLFELDFLEFVNLIGNPVPYIQIEELEKMGVVVLTDRVGNPKLEFE
ncbi:MAG: leucine-rich repeat domain-containing protein [Saprospiraceae bacterium]|nr:leucine-rich repeat domain-containing protein [Lewinella sp.]